MVLTERRLNRAALDRQFLLKRTDLDPVQVVERLVGLQAQDAASPYLALWSRCQNFDAAALDTAFASRALVKASLMRITLHAVSVRDYGTWYAAMGPSLRASRENDRRFVPAQLTKAAVDALIPELTTFLAQARTDAEIEQWMSTRVSGDPAVAWWGLRTFAPNFRLPTGGPWSFAGLAYDAPQSGVGGEVAVAVETLLLRYLGSFGPATAADFARFTLLRSPVVNQALKALNDRLVRFSGTDGKTYWDLADHALPDEDTPSPPRLLPMWDNLLLGHVSSQRILPAEFRRSVIQVNGDILPTVLVDGVVAGVWRQRGRAVEVSSFRTLTPGEWQGIEAEAVGLAAFVADRDPKLYSRHQHWWAKGLPVVEVCTFG